MKRNGRTQVDESRVEKIDIDAIVFADKNPKKHDGDALTASEERYGFVEIPVINSATGKLVAGEGRIRALRALRANGKGVPRGVTVRAGKWLVDAKFHPFASDAEAQAYLVDSNNLGLLGGEMTALDIAKLWDADGYAEIVQSLADVNALPVSIPADDVNALLLGLGHAGAPEETVDAGELIDRAAELNKKWQVARGDLFEIPSKTVPGKAHRILCGDSTNAEDVAKVMQGEKAKLCDADPPYGMGKENEGIANDNLYREKLDKFQMQWWRAWRPYLEDNASAYVWGNADDLWRLWYCGGLRDSERLAFRNEIVWKKEGALGIGSASHRQYPTASERCLVFMLGEQGFNINADNYWEGWEPIRKYLADEVEKCGGKMWADKVTDSQMAKHYFTKSQWSMPTRDMYEKMQRAAHGKAFKREFDELKREFDELKREFHTTRAFFDNTHENMTDVWSFPRVVGEERYGHATPKLVAMISRIIKTSAPIESIVAVPFVGSAPDFVAGEQTGRLVYGIEIEPRYVSVCLERLSSLGLTPVLRERNGASVNS